MGKGFGIGKLLGIRIRVDWSWLLIFVLTTWNLGSVFGEMHADWGSALTWAMAVGAALLFFVSVLLHELAHSLVARARGIPVRSITLFLFGGVSSIQRELRSPGAEFWMAIVGPPTVPSTISIDELAHEHVMKTDDHAFPVVDDGHLSGLVTLEDVRSRSRDHWDDILLREIMTPAEELVTVAPETDAAQALERLMARDVRQLPVMENGSLSGCLRRRDIVK